MSTFLDGLRYRPYLLVSHKSPNLGADKKEQCFKFIFHAYIFRVLILLGRQIFVLNQRAGHELNSPMLMVKKIEVMNDLQAESEFLGRYLCCVNS